MLRKIGSIFGAILIVLACIILAEIIGSVVVENLQPEFEFNGAIGYEAGGQIGFFIGLIIGLYFGLKLIIKTFRSHPKPIKP